MLQTFLREEIIPVSKFLNKPKNYLKGVVRLVDRSSKLVGIFFDKAAVDELREEFESKSPEFIKKIEQSRVSGRVSAAAVKKRLKL